jgi:hypothetical protein
MGDGVAGPFQVAGKPIKVAIDIIAFLAGYAVSGRLMTKTVCLFPR